MSFDKYAVFDILEYDPHYGQRVVHQNPARFKVVCCGRRWGKSQMAGHEMTAALIDPSNAKKTFWIVGPTYELGEREFEVVYHDILKLPIFQADATWRTLYVQATCSHNAVGHRCKGRVSYESEVIAGQGTLWRDYVRGCYALEDTWSQYIRPALSDHKGWALFPSTPKGFNWFYEHWLRGGDTNFAQWD